MTALDSHVRGGRAARRHRAGSGGAAVVCFVAWVGLAVSCAPRAAAPVQQPAPTPLPPAAPLPWEAEVQADPVVTSPQLALVGATLMTAAGPEIPDGVLLLRGGRIAAVGRRDAVPLGSDTPVLDVSGKFVTPGIIDAHSHMGVYAVPHVGAHADGNEMTSPVTAHVRAQDAFWPQDPALSYALAAGVTSILVLPGSANLIGGQGVTVKLVPGLTASEMRFPGAPRTLKMACGENPKRVYGGRKSAPSTRMGNMAGYRAAFQKAIEYGGRFRAWQEKHRRWQRAEQRSAEEAGSAPAMPGRDFGLETLLGAIEGRVLVQMHCYRADEMLAMLDLASEFGFRIRAFHHAIEAYKIRDVLASREVGIATWADWWGFKMEAFDAVFENLSLASQRGVIAALHSDSSSLVQFLNQEAAKAMAAGLRAGIPTDRVTALRWITINPAWALGIHQRTGSLEVGKMADVVVWDGDPFSVYSRPQRVFIDGRVAYEASVGRRPSDFELGQQTEGSR